MGDARSNPAEAFLTRIVSCVRCGKANRFLFDDRLIPKCGNCGTHLPTTATSIADTDPTGISRAEDGMPLPLRDPPRSRWRRAWEWLIEFIVVGNPPNPKLVAQRERRAHAATIIYRQLCDATKERQRQIERARREAAAEEAKRREAQRIREQEAAELRARRESQREAEERARLQEVEVRARRAAAEQQARQREAELKEYERSLEGRLDRVDDMTGREFEHYLQAVFETKGLTVQLTKASHDQGVDLVVTTRGGARIAVQAKRCRGPAGNWAVQEALGGIFMYRCDRALVICSSRFTKSAIALAKSTDGKVRLWNRQRLREFIRGERMIDATDDWQ